MSSHAIAIAASEWRLLQGIILDGGYELKNAIELNDAEAVFKVHVLGAGGLEAIARFYSAEPASLDEQLLLWEAVKELPHPNLARPLAAGRKSIGGVEAAYVVLGIPDEKLSGVLAERALSEEESVEVLQCAARALEHLHANGLTHGCVSPETVLANGDSIQLAGECVRWLNARPPFEVTRAAYLAPESEGVNNTVAADVWCLGATLFEVLSQKAYIVENHPKLEAVPLTGLLRRCLEKHPLNRCQLPEARAIALHGPATPVADETAATPPFVDTANLNGHPAAHVVEPDIEPEGEARAAKMDGASSLGAAVPVEARLDPIRSKRQPVEAKVKLLGARTEETLALMKLMPAQLERRRVRLKTKPGAWRGAIAGALGVLMLFALIWLVIVPRFESPLAPADVKEASQNVPLPPKGKAWPTRTLPASDETLPDARSLPTAGAPAHTEWRVVLYSYEHQQDADRRIELLNRNHPGVPSHLFIPASGGPYMVVTGGALSRDRAAALRLRAIRLGLPSTIQIQSFRR
ncbi:MAG TPA: hypothetical protein VGL97_15130 [Bryobacteraceae bacterium]|jgi:hypothetical protein